MQNQNDPFENLPTQSKAYRQPKASSQSGPEFENTMAIITDTNFKLEDLQPPVSGELFAGQTRMNHDKG